MTPNTPGCIAKSQAAYHASRNQQASPPLPGRTRVRRAGTLPNLPPPEQSQALLLGAMKDRRLVVRIPPHSTTCLQRNGMSAQASPRRGVPCGDEQPLGDPGLIGSATEFSRHYRTLSAGTDDRNLQGTTDNERFEETAAVRSGESMLEGYSFRREDYRFRTRSRPRRHCRQSGMVDGWPRRQSSNSSRARSGVVNRPVVRLT